MNLFERINTVADKIAELTISIEDIDSAIKQHQTQVDQYKALRAKCRKELAEWAVALERLKAQNVTEKAQKEAEEGLQRIKDKEKQLNDLIKKAKETESEPKE